MVSSNILAGAVAFLPISVVNAAVCYPGGSSTTLSTAATSTADDSLTVPSTTATASASTDTSSSLIIITTTTSASESQSQAASTSTTSIRYPADMFPCEEDKDCLLNTELCDGVRCGCLDTSCRVVPDTPSSSTSSTSVAPSDPTFPYACAVDSDCWGASFCIDDGYNICTCVNAICFITQAPPSMQDD